MGFVSSTIRSIKKSFRLRKLQRCIAPQGSSSGSSWGIEAFLKSAAERDRAVEEYLDLCVADGGVKAVMEIEGLSRADLKEMYQRLLAQGLGGWVKGHFMPLSTIAYPEPLLYLARSRRAKITPDQVSFDLLQYWEGKIPQGSLLRQLR
jgi:hypothetical protein